VTVRDAKLIKRVEGFVFGLLALTSHREVVRLMIEHKDGGTELMDDVLEQVIASWDVIFRRDGL
jgi:hypothetical protein